MLSDHMIFIIKFATNFVNNQATVGEWQMKTENYFIPVVRDLSRKP